MYVNSATLVSSPCRHHPVLQCLAATAYVLKTEVIPLSLTQPSTSCVIHGNLLISSQPHAQTLPLTYSALSLCSLHFPNTHTHTSTRILSCTTHPHKHKNITFFALSTPAAQDHFPPGHRHCQNHCTLYNSDPFLYLDTLCVNMFSLCVCICDLCMYVCR